MTESTEDTPKPKKTTKPKQTGETSSVETQNDSKQEEPKSMKNDNYFHVPFMLALISLACFGTLWWADLRGNDDRNQERQQLQQEYRGYRDGVKDSK